MDRYTRAFIVASLIYLLLGSVLGILIGTSARFASYQFTHVHFNLLGFMAMMIYGVGYFILPRFNAKSLRWPGMVAVHFYLANAGLLGMSVFRQLGYSTQSALAEHGFVTFAVIEVVSVFLFVANMVATLASPSISVQRMPGAGPATGAAGPAGPRARAASSGPGTASAAPGGPDRAMRRIEPSMRVGEILERYPGSRLILAEAGIKALASEAHAEQVKRMPVTLQAACMKHGVDMEALLEKLERFVADGSPGEESGSGKRGEAPAGSPTGGDGITAEMNIGEVLARFPETSEVFLRYFGSGCFDCPGQVMESISQGALMHDVDVSELLSALNRAIGR